MTWEGTREIEEADQTEDTDQTEDNAPETHPPNAIWFSHPFPVDESARTDRPTRLPEI